ncbi:MAG: hypothetical protein IKN85_02985 [Oscillospiraceae bacterium]|nr:hypothetical protein [Oscillospiraceae bacterium]MBR6837320.1 hypothetical protein [Oscillospiraceae bacterium]
MKAERLRDAIWKIDDKFIKEAETYVPKKRSGNTIWIITSASAAVIALCTCVHYHNAVNKVLRPEIDNTVAIVTTVTETELYETDVLKTEKPVQSSDTVRENTEVTETETGYESSISYAETVPTKTEAPSENGGSSGEKTGITEKPQEVTKVPATEPAEVTSEVQTVVAGTELAVTDRPIQTAVAVTEAVVTDKPAGTDLINTIPAQVPTPSNTSVPGPAEEELVTTTERPASPSSESETTIPVYTDVTNICVTGYSEVSIEDFPMYLMTSDGVRYDRAEIMYSDKVGRFIKQDVMTDVYGNSYTVNVYLLDGFYGDTIRIFYFYNKECYVSYAKDKNN